MQIAQSPPGSALSRGQGSRYKLPWPGPLCGICFCLSGYYHYKLTLSYQAQVTAQLGVGLSDLVSRFLAGPPLLAAPKKFLFFSHRERTCSLWTGPWIPNASLLQCSDTRGRQQCFYGVIKRNVPDTIIMSELHLDFLNTFPQMFSDIKCH
jgi:hypothetical protein